MGVEVGVVGVVTCGAGAGVADKFPPADESPQPAGTRTLPNQIVLLQEWRKKGLNIVPPSLQQSLLLSISLSNLLSIPPTVSPFHYSFHLSNSLSIS